MMTPGTVQNGHVVPSRPLGLPEGHPVYIVSTTPIDPKRRHAALARLRSRAVAVSLPERAFATDSLYEDNESP